MSNVNLSIYNEMMGEVVSNLKNEIKELTFKVQKARKDENWGTYKNLILAYKEIIKLYKEIVDEVSETEGNKTQHIKNNMTISLDKNTLKLMDKAFVRKKVTDDNTKDMYIDVARVNGGGTATALVYCNGKITYIKEKTFKDIVDIIENHTVEDKNIYIDTFGIGKGVADELDSRNIKYKKLEINKIQN